MTPKQQRFYVYRLVDPRDDQPFYIGKGTGRRAYTHAANVRRGVIDNGAKCRRIAEIIAGGQNVRVDFVAVDLSEADAFAMERGLIADGVGLTNIAGGTVSSTEAQAERIALNIAAIKPYDYWIDTIPQATIALVERVWGDTKSFYDWYVGAWAKLAKDPRQTVVLP